MKIRLGLRAKMTALLIAAATVILVVFYRQFDRMYEKSVMNKYIDIASSVASLGATVIDGDVAVKYFDLEKPDENYYVWEDKLKKIKMASGVNYLYIFRLEEEEQLMRYMYDIALPGENYDFAVFGGTYPYEPEAYTTAFEVMETGQPSQGLEVTKTVIGYLASAYAPIKDSQGKVIALIGVDINMDHIIAEKDNQLLQMMKNCGAVIAGCFLLMLIIVQISVIKPIRRLKEKVTEMADGKLGVQAMLRGRNEITEISKVFNRMSKNIEGHILETEALNHAYYKFVPSKFFEILQRSSVTEVKLGDQRNTELTVLTISTDSFDSLVSKMNNEGTFSFINKVLYNCVPVVMQYSGVIERFEGAGLTAFFTEDGKLNCNEAALESSISILQQMEANHEKEKFSKFVGNVQVRFGIAYGAIKLGIVGHEKRMEAITISEQRLVAQFLTRIAGKYYSSILITETAAATIPEFKERYHNRCLGYVYLSSTGCLEKIYDVFDGDVSEDVEQKKQTKELFEQGIELFYNRKFYQARMVFVEVLKQFRKDSASREYLYLCDQYYSQEPSFDFNLCIESL